MSCPYTLGLAILVHNCLTSQLLEGLLGWLSPLCPNLGSHNAQGINARAPAAALNQQQKKVEV